MAKVFKANELGVFTVAVTSAGLITDISAIGTETGTVNFVGRLINKDQQKQNELKENIKKLSVTNADQIIAKEILKAIHG